MAIARILLGVLQGVTGLLLEFQISITWVLQGCWRKGLSGVLQETFRGCYSSVITVLQES